MMKLAFIFSLLLPFASALHASEAGVVDWHKAQTGVPLTHSHSLSPTFHRYGTGTAKKSTKSVVLTVTSANVLAALDPVNGDLVWRYVFDSSDPVVGFRAQGDVVVALSGPGGASLRTFDIQSGDLLAERRQHVPSSGLLFHPSDLGAHVVFAEQNDATDTYVLTNGHTIRRVDSLSGQTKWEWAAADKVSSVIYSRIAHTRNVVYLVGLTKSAASYTLHVSTFSASTGELLADAHIPSTIHDGLTDFLVLSDTADDESAPYIVWLEKGALKFVRLTETLDAKAKHLKGSSFKRILNIGLNERGWFVALKEDGTGVALRTDKDSMGLKHLWEFAESAASDRYSESIYTGGLDKDNFPYVGRVFWSHYLSMGSAHVFASHLANGTGLVRGYTFPFQTDKHGIIAHATLDAASPQEHVVIARFVLTTGTGAVQLWQHDRAMWTREEGLSEIKVAEFVDLPEKKAAAAFTQEEDETFVERMTRQLVDAKDFPSYILAFAKRFATGSYATAVTPGSSSSSESLDSLSRDTFGFRKVIVAASKRGVVFGIDSSTGAILWSRILGLGWAAKVGGHHVPLKLFVTRTANDVEGESPQVVLITQRVADNGLSDTVAFHINALTGEDAQGKSPAGEMLQGIDLVEGEIVDGFLLSALNKTVVVVDKFLQVHLFPDSDTTQAAFKGLVPKLHFPLLSPGRLLGHEILPELEVTGKFVAHSTWTTFLPEGEEVLAKFGRSVGPIASFGKVLGDRSTLYKYLNPNIVGLLTISRPSQGGKAPTCGVYLIDGAKGTIIYHSVVPSQLGYCNVKATLTENWLLYTYYDDDVASAVQAKGYRAISVELYEGNQVNDKTRSLDASIYYNKNAEVSVYEQAYVFPTAVTAIATTSTKFGIATKDLIVANHRGQIQTFPRRMFDPRRPKRKVTAEEQEEWLVQYDPLIPDDSRRVISHNYQVKNIERIVTSPALLESTSLVFAYGLDLFSSRVAPSQTFDVLSENFNKVQLVLTVAALAAGIVVTKPIVRRKRLREQWY